MLSEIDNLARYYHQPKLCIWHISMYDDDRRCHEFLCVFDLSKFKEAKAHLKQYATDRLTKWTMEPYIEVVRDVNLLEYKICRKYLSHAIGEGWMYCYDNCYELSLISFNSPKFKPKPNKN